MAVQTYPVHDSVISYGLRRRLALRSHVVYFYLCLHYTQSLTTASMSELKKKNLFTANDPNYTCYQTLDFLPYQHSRTIPHPAPFLTTSPLFTLTGRKKTKNLRKCIHSGLFTELPICTTNSFFPPFFSWKVCFKGNFNDKNTTRMVVRLKKNPKNKTSGRYQEGRMT